MGDAAGRPIGMLSKGFKRRAALAAAIAHDPAVLILDEPTDGLDPNQKDGVRALIRMMAPDKTILISTHLLDEVEAICTRAIVITGGAHCQRYDAGRPDLHRARSEPCGGLPQC